MRLRDRNKEDLVKDKACELIVSLGFDGFSMNKLAKACGISVGTLYIYYKDKEDLFQKLGAQISTEYYNAMLDNFDLKMDFKSGLWLQWKNRARFAIDYPHKIAFHHSIQTSNYREYVLTESQKNITSLFDGFIKKCIDSKEIVPVSKEVFWSIAYGPLYTLIRFHNRGKSYGDEGYQINEVEMKKSFELVTKALEL